MKFSIVFDKSGDELEFITLDSTRAEVLEYYVDNLARLDSNLFTSTIPADTIDALINNLHQSIIESNGFIKNIVGKSIEEYSTEDYIDQSTLNRLHADWVRSQNYKYNIQENRQSPDPEIAKIADKLHEQCSDDVETLTLSTVLEKLGHTEYHQINDRVHDLESSFNSIKFSTKTWTQFENCFSKSLINNDLCNFRISFHHLGRCLYNKYQFFDDALEYDDENSFDELLGFVDVNLFRNQTIPLSQEYIAWCRKHNKVPSGNYLNIGNLPDLDSRLTEYRLIVYRNIRNRNSFSIKLNKGR